MKQLYFSALVHGPQQKKSGEPSRGVLQGNKRIQKGLHTSRNVLRVVTGNDIQTFTLESCITNK